VQLVGDQADDVRSNAALALARQGRDEAYAPLGEMLALADPGAGPGAAAGGEEEAAAQSRRYKRALVVVNALRGVALLVDATHAAPPGNVVERVRQLEQDPVSDVRSSAKALLEKVTRLSAAGSTPSGG
jgi:hypothetical protein